jgi:hypothetical protein
MGAGSYFSRRARRLTRSAPSSRLVSVGIDRSRLQIGMAEGGGNKVDRRTVVEWAYWCGMVARNGTEVQSQRSGAAHRD